MFSATNLEIVPKTQNQSCGIISDGSASNSTQGSPSNDALRVEGGASTAGSQSVGDPSNGHLQHNFASLQPAVPRNQTVEGAVSGRSAVSATENVPLAASPWANTNAPPRMSAVPCSDTATPRNQSLVQLKDATVSTQRSAQGTSLSELESAQNGSALQKQNDQNCIQPHSAVHSQSSSSALALQSILSTPINNINNNINSNNSNNNNKVLAQVPERERERVRDSGFSSSHHLNTSNTNTSQFLNNSYSSYSSYNESFNNNATVFKSTSSFSSTSPHMSALQTPERTTTSALRAACNNNNKINNKINNTNTNNKAPVAFLPEVSPRNSSLPVCDKSENDCRRETLHCGVVNTDNGCSERGLQHSQSEPVVKVCVRNTPQLPNCASLGHFCHTEGAAPGPSERGINDSDVTVQRSVPDDRRMRDSHTPSASEGVENEHRGGRKEPTLEIKRFPSNQKRNRLIPRVVSLMTRMVVAERRGIKPPERCTGANNKDNTAPQTDNEEWERNIAELFNTSEALVFLCEGKKGRNILTDINETITEFKELDIHSQMVPSILVLNRLIALSRLFTLEGTLKDLGLSDAEIRYILAGRIPTTILDKIKRMLSTLFFLGGLPVERFLEDSISSNVLNPIALGIPLILLPLPLPLWLFRGIDPSGLQPHYADEMNSTLRINKQVLDRISKLWNCMNSSGTHAAQVNSEHSNGYFRVEYDPIKRECNPIFPSRKNKTELNSQVSLPDTPLRNGTSTTKTPKSSITPTRTTPISTLQPKTGPVLSAPSTTRENSLLSESDHETAPQSRHPVKHRSTHSDTETSITSNVSDTQNAISNSQINVQAIYPSLTHTYTEPIKQTIRSQPQLKTSKSFYSSVRVPEARLTQIDQIVPISNASTLIEEELTSSSPTISEAPTQVVSDSEHSSSPEEPLLPTPVRCVSKRRNSERSLEPSENDSAPPESRIRYGTLTQRSQTRSISSETEDSRHTSPIDVITLKETLDPDMETTLGSQTETHISISIQSDAPSTQTIETSDELQLISSKKSSNHPNHVLRSSSDGNKDKSIISKPEKGLKTIASISSTIQKTLAKAATLFSRELQREHAKTAGKTVLPAPSLSSRRISKNKTIRMVHSPRKEKPLITINDLQEFHPEQGCVRWRQEDTNRYGSIVADLTFQVLSQIDKVLYSGLVDKNDFESLCNLLNGIPGSVLLHTRLRTANQGAKLKRRINPKPRRTRSIYASEMHPYPDPGNLVVVDEDERNLNTHSQVRSILENLHLRDTNVFNPYIHKSLNPNNQESSPMKTLDISERNAIEGLISRGNISQGVEKLNDSLETDSQKLSDSSTAYSKLCEMHSDQPDLRDIHVEVTPRDFVSIEHNTITNIVQMKEILDSLNKRSAADAAGWSVSLITNIISHQPAITQLLMRFINACLIHQYWPAFLFDCRIIAIPKPHEEGKYRPITITSTWRKIISKAVLKIHSSVLNSSISTSQYGVSKVYGTECIISSIQSALDLAHTTKQSLTITQLDLSNAYNLVDRALLLDTLKETGLHSSALSYFAYMFRGERLFYYEGQSPVLIPNTRGISQGEPCSPMLFTIYLASLTDETNNKACNGEFGRIDNHFLHSCQVPTVMSYLDDIFLLSPTPEIAQSTLQWLLQKLISIGMKPNLAKTHILVHTNEGLIDSKTNIEITLDHSETPVVVSASTSLKILGSLVTLDQTTRNEFFIEKAIEVLNSMFGALQLHLQNFMLVARLCISSKLVHLLRTLVVPNSILSDFDEVVKQVIVRVFNLSRTAMTELIFLPQQRGGLGLTALSSIQLISALSLYSEMLKLPHLHNIAIEYLQTLPSAVTNHCSFGDLFWHKGIDEDTAEKCGFLTLCHLFEPLTSLQNLLNVGYNDTTNQNNTFVQHNLWMKQTEKQYSDLLKDKKVSSPDQYVTLLATSKDTSCSAWLRAVPFANYQKMTDGEFMHSIRYRLGTPDKLRSLVDSLPSHLFKNNKKHVPSGAGLNAAETNAHLLCPLCGCTLGRYHFANCQMNGPIRTSRHTLIKRLLANAIAQIPTVSVVVEDYNLEQSSNEHKVPDITVTINDPTRQPTELEQTLLKSNRPSTRPNSFSIDIVIKDIHASSDESKHKNGMFAEIGEEEKRRIYRSLGEKEGIKCLPFGLSSVGELGRTAKAIIRFINEMAARSCVYINTETLVEQISLLLETSRYEMEQAYHEEVQLRVNKLSGWQNRNNTALVPSIEVQGRVPKVVGFWSRQIKKTTNFLQMCNEDTISQQRRAQIEHDLFSWIPGAEYNHTSQECLENINSENTNVRRAAESIMNFALSLVEGTNIIDSVKKPPDRDKDNPRDNPVSTSRKKTSKSKERRSSERFEKKRVQTVDRYSSRRSRIHSRKTDKHKDNNINRNCREEQMQSEQKIISSSISDTNDNNNKSYSSTFIDKLKQDFIPFSQLHESPCSLSSTSRSNFQNSSSFNVNPVGSPVVGAGYLNNPHSSAPAELPLVNNWAFYFPQHSDGLHLQDNNIFTFPCTSPLSSLHAFPV